MEHFEPSQEYWEQVAELNNTLYSMSDKQRIPGLLGPLWTIAMETWRSADEHGGRASWSTMRLLGLVGASSELRLEGHDDVHVHGGEMTVTARAFIYKNGPVFGVPDLQLRSYVTSLGAEGGAETTRQQRNEIRAARKMSARYEDQLGLSIPDEADYAAYITELERGASGLYTLE